MQVIHPQDTIPEAQLLIQEDTLLNDNTITTRT